ncbi:unnamed protein product [Callosobruchus maculatus]|uniref:Uncharacterized protein n=1 Tax=Callosobruchus maculatus TaxID=64391 RepID=A0A653BN91_CALMS|nr:unnamed protein product [Callosobruchus maculatus]
MFEIPDSQEIIRIPDSPESVGAILEANGVDKEASNVPNAESVTDIEEVSILTKNMNVENHHSFLAVTATTLPSKKEI